MDNHEEGVENGSNEEENLYQCSQCSQIFNNLNLIYQHIAEDHGESQVQQQENKENIPIEEQNHDVAANDEKVFQCNTCGALFETKEQILDHQARVHQQLAVSKCNFCEEYFNESDLPKHLELDHSTSNKENIQPDFQQQENPPAMKIDYDDDVKKEHIEEDDVNDVSEAEESVASMINEDTNGIKCTKCDFCKELIPGGMAGQMHINQHLNVKEPTCEYCYKVFEIVQKFDSHLATMEKIECDLCKSVLGNFENVKNHFEYVHEISEENPKCDFCVKLFQSSKIQHIKKHVISVHTKSDKCEVCDETFTLIGNYKTHISTMHDKVPMFKCQFRNCRKTFTYHWDLDGHVQKHELIINDDTSGDIFIFCKHCNSSLEGNGFALMHFKNNNRCRGQFTKSGFDKLKKMVNSKRRQSTKKADEDDDDEEFIPKRARSEN